MFGVQKKLLTNLNLGTQLAGEGHFFCQKPTFCTFDEMVGLGGGGGPCAHLYYLEYCYFILARAVGGSVDDAVCWG